MSFPMLSTSVETPVIKRVGRVMNRAKSGRLIKNGGVYNCRQISGSSSWSQHAWGNAVDLFPKSDRQADLRQIADAVVTQTTKRTFANRGRKLAVSQVIDHDAGRIWTRVAGWRDYNGSTGAHIHVSGAPLKTGTPPCASG